MTSALFSDTFVLPSLIALVGARLALPRRHSEGWEQLKSAAMCGFSDQASELFGTVNRRDVAHSAAPVRQLPENELPVAGTDGTVDVPVEDAGSTTRHRKSVEHFRCPFVLAVAADGRFLVAPGTVFDDVELVGSVDVFVAATRRGSPERRIGPGGGGGGGRGSLPRGRRRAPDRRVVLAAVAVRAAGGVAEAVSRVERKSGRGIPALAPSLARHLVGVASVRRRGVGAVLEISSSAADTEKQTPRDQKDRPGAHIGRQTELRLFRVKQNGCRQNDWMELR